jgi:hypothetical protein
MSAAFSLRHSMIAAVRPLAIARGPMKEDLKIVRRPQDIIQVAFFLCAPFARAKDAAHIALSRFAAELRESE